MVCADRWTVWQLINIQWLLPDRGWPGWSAQTAELTECGGPCGRLRGPNPCHVGFWRPSQLLAPCSSSADLTSALITSNAMLRQGLPYLCRTSDAMPWQGLLKLCLTWHLRTLWKCRYLRLITGATSRRNNRYPCASEWLTMNYWLSMNDSQWTIDWLDFWLCELFYCSCYIVANLLTCYRCIKFLKCNIMLYYV